MSPVETVTVLFTDLVGSTGMASRIGPAAAEEVRREHFRILREAIGDVGGSEVKNLGDGLMVKFSSASAALGCAAAMQRRIARRNRRAEEQLSIRVGVSLGEATREDDDYFGPPVIEASRLCAAAEGDEVLVSELAGTTASRRDHDLHPVGELSLKGLPDPLTAFRLAWQTGEEEPGPPLPPRLREAPRVEFVGRAEERARLGEIATAARAGRRQLVLISGEPGIGKTRLATDTALEMRGRGAAVLFGRSTEGLEAPFRAWAEALSHYVEHGPQRVLERHAERHGGELTRLVPRLGLRIPGLPPPKQTDSETERYLLLAAAVGLLQEASREQTLVVVLDDLQWADSQTLALLKHLVTSVTDAELALLATHRDAELSRGNPLNQLLGDLRHEGGIERIDLTGIGREDVGALMRAAVGYEPGAGAGELAEEIARETDGNPFFATELLRHLDESGAIAANGADRDGPRRPLADLGLPQSVREVVTSRAERLGKESAALLSSAAVIGRDFDLDLLSRIVEPDEERLLDLLEGAVKASLLQEGRTAGQFSFAHSLVNHTLYELSGPTRRGQTHRRIAEALVEICGEDPGERAGEVAMHWLRASSPAKPRKAAHYCSLAGERALADLAPEEALNWYQRALDLLDAMPEAEPRQRCDVLIGLGDAQRQAGRDSFNETLLEASEIAYRLTDGVRMVRAAEANTRGFASVVGRIDQRRVRALEDALRLCEKPQQRAHLLSLLAVELSYTGDLERRLELSGKAVQLARESGDRHALAWALARRQTAIAVPATLGERIAEAEELIGLAEEMDDPMLRYWAHVWQAMDAIDRGDFETARRGGEVQEEIAAATGQPMFHWVNTFAPVVLACMAGEFERAEKITNHSAKVGTEGGQPDVLAIYAGQIHAIRYEQGRLDEVLEVQERVVEEAPLIEAYSTALALSYCELGEPEKARAILHRFAADGFEVTANQSSKNALCFLAEVAARVDEPNAAAILYERLLPWRDQLNYTGITMFGPVERYLGLAATCLGRYGEAELHFRRSAETCERIGAPTWLARSRHEWALALRKRREPGDREQAERLLEQALEAASAYGCRSLEWRVRAEMPGGR
ncbi:MAG TPA: AAA family ATPase [Solirubrobacterales bacterium]|nr:AAA family ATPase [Solirubrobacterales bacterium]